MSSELQNCQLMKIQTSTTIRRLRKKKVTQQTPSQSVIVTEMRDTSMLSGNATLTLSSTQAESDTQSFRPFQINS